MPDLSPSYWRQNALHLASAVAYHIGWIQPRRAVRLKCLVEVTSMWTVVVPVNWRAVMAGGEDAH